MNGVETNAYVGRKRFPRSVTGHNAAMVWSEKYENVLPDESLSKGGWHWVSVIKLGFSGGSIKLFAGNVKLSHQSSQESTEGIGATQWKFNTSVDSSQLRRQ